MVEEKKADKAGTEKPAPDPRAVAFVVALVPAVGEVQPTEEQKKLAEQIDQLIQAAQKKSADKKPDEAAVKQASDAFFAGSVSSEEAHKKADEEAKKEQDALAKAYAAAATEGAKSLQPEMGNRVAGPASHR